MDQTLNTFPSNGLKQILNVGAKGETLFICYSNYGNEVGVEVMLDMKSLQDAYFCSLKSYSKIKYTCYPLSRSHYTLYTSCCRLLYNSVYKTLSL